MAHRAELSLAVRTFTAGNLEGHCDALTGMKGFNRWPHSVDFAHEFVAENVALLEGKVLTFKCTSLVKIRAYTGVRKRGCGVAIKEFGQPQTVVPVTLTR